MRKEKMSKKISSIFLIMYILFLIGHLGVFMIRQYGIRQYERGRIKGILIYYKDVQEVRMVGKKRMIGYFK